MPLYEYECEACQHRFEVIQKFSDAPIEVCPKCGGAVHKLLSSPAIQFKGSGWYITDYARSGKTDSAGVAPGKTETPAAGGDAAAPAKSESKADSKPAAKTPTSTSSE